MEQHTTARDGNAVPVIYANATRTHGGAFDVMIDFGIQRGADDPHWTASVALSYEHTQALVETLRNAIDKYQEQVGPLPDLTPLKPTREGD